MEPARWPRDQDAPARLLVVHADGCIAGDAGVADLARYLDRGDVLVLNDAATLPASFAARTADGAAVELRIARVDPGESFTAVLFGEGDWRTPTELRPAPAAVSRGDRLVLEGGLTAAITSVDPVTARLVSIRFNRTGDPLWTALYARGRPVQYAYVREPLPLWHVQTLASSRPWSVECPSAALPLTAAVFGSLRARGVTIATLTHGAGLSSTGDATLDARFPLAEHYSIPEATARAVNGARGRVIAVGTTVVRALEASATKTGRILAGDGVATIRLGPHTPLHLVDGLLTGMHEPGTSHFELLGAFANPVVLQRAWSESESRAYLGHEFGDSALFFADELHTQS